MTVVLFMPAGVELPSAEMEKKKNHDLPSVSLRRLLWWTVSSMEGFQQEYKKVLIMLACIIIWMILCLYVDFNVHSFIHWIHSSIWDFCFWCMNLYILVERIAHPVHLFLPNVYWLHDLHLLMLHLIQAKSVPSQQSFLSMCPMMA